MSTLSMQLQYATCHLRKTGKNRLSSAYTTRTVIPSSGGQISSSESFSRESVYLLYSTKYASCAVSAFLKALLAALSSLRAQRIKIAPWRVVSPASTSIRIGGYSPMIHNLYFFRGFFCIARPTLMPPLEVHQLLFLAPHSQSVNSSIRRQLHPFQGFVFNRNSMPRPCQIFANWFLVKNLLPSNGSQISALSLLRPI